MPIAFHCHLEPAIPDLHSKLHCYSLKFNAVLRQLYTEAFSYLTSYLLRTDLIGAKLYLTMAIDMRNVRSLTCRNPINGRLIESEWNVLSINASPFAMQTCRNHPR